LSTGKRQDTRVRVCHGDHDERVSSNGWRSQRTLPCWPVR
jgi:hypothetical protein